MPSLKQFFHPVEQRWHVFLPEERGAPAISCGDQEMIDVMLEAIVIAFEKHERMAQGS